MTRFLPALDSRDMRLFLAGQLVSVVGSWMQSVALGWLVLTLTGSAFWLGVSTAVRFVPALLVALPAGLLADRRDRRVVMIWTSLAGAVSAAILGVLAVSGRADIWAILVVTFVAGAANSIEAPARQAYVAELAGADRRSGAIALNSLIWNGARVVGPAIAGVLVVAVGPGPVFLVNALSYAAVVAALVVIRHRPGRPGTAGPGAYRELVGYLRATPTVAWLLLLIGANTMLASGYLYLGPAIAWDLGAGAEGLGLLLSAAGVGAVVAGARLAVQPAAVPGVAFRRRLLLVPAVLTAVAAGGIAVSGSLPVTAVLFGAMAMGSVSFNVTTNTRIQGLVPDRLRGRVMSLYALMLFGLIPPGSLILGALGDAVGAAVALGVGGLAWAAVAVPVFLAVPALRAR